MGNAFSSVPTGLAAEIVGTEALMSKKAHGTCSQAVQANLRWSVSNSKADEICCFNRHYAEHSGYFLTSKAFLEEAQKASNAGEEMSFYDSVTGKKLFVAPRGRSWKEFLAESKAHGWPSFRDAEVVKDFVRVLPNGEAVSTEGTHLGHNLPDGSGNRYCINLVSVAGSPDVGTSKSDL